jgi:hypothetical protein
MPPWMRWLANELEQRESDDLGLGRSALKQKARREDGLHVAITADAQ